MTDKEKIRAEIERQKKLYEDSLTNPIHQGFGLQNVIKAKISELTYLHSFIDSMQEEPVSKDLEEAAEEWDESLYRSDAFKAGAKWLNNTICSEIEKRLQYMQYAPHRADTYKELKSLLAYIKSFV